MRSLNRIHKCSVFVNVIRQNKLTIYSLFALAGTILQLIFDPSIFYFALAFFTFGFAGLPIWTLGMFSYTRKNRRFFDRLCSCICLLIFVGLIGTLAVRTFPHNASFDIFLIWIFNLALSFFQVLAGGALRIQLYEQSAKKSNKKAKIILFRLYSYLHHPRKIFWIADIALKGDTEAQYWLSDYFFQVAFLKRFAYFEIASKRLDLEGQRLLQRMQQNNQPVTAEEACRLNKTTNRVENAMYQCNVHVEALQLVAHDNIYAEFRHEICCNNIYDARKDIKQAVYWCKQAAKNGFPPAQYNLGVCYECGYGVVKDPANAVDWYTKAAEQGVANAQLNLAQCYADAEGVEEDGPKAVYWYTKAAEQGRADAQCNLGACYECGYGVEKDAAKAVYWYTKAAEQGFDEAQLKLGGCYQTGNGITKDKFKAVEWYTKAAEQGNAEAQINLGLCYENGNGVVKDYTLAASWFEKVACQDAEQQNDAFAQKWITLAQIQLGKYYMQGLGVSRDYKMGAYWLTKAAEREDAFAQGMLAKIYDLGIGVERDSAKAIHWYKQAAKQGNENAQKKLKELGESW